MQTLELLQSTKSHLVTLADAWIEAGARGFYVACDGQVWLRRGETEQPGVIAPIWLEQEPIGEIGVSGLLGRPAQRRLDADARMVTHLVRQEFDLRQMTGALIEVQDQLLAFYDLTRAMRGQIGLEGTLRLLAGETARLVRSASALLLMGSLQVYFPQPLLENVAIQQYARQVQEHGRELVLNDGQAGSLGLGINNLCLLPIAVRGENMAVLGLLNKGGGFAAPDLKLARAIAEHAGSQIEHALLHQETLSQARLQAEMEVARKVQLQMLPQHRPDSSSLDVFAESRPAREVGGDFYDFIDQPNRPLIAILGDVSGKGMSAALIMGMIHAITNSAARFMPMPDPAALIARANEYLYDDFTTLATFATVFVCAYDPATRLLRYANAGHAPVIYRPASGMARLLEADAAPVGVLPISLCQTHTLVLQPGDLLVVATDGFNEASNKTGEMFGYDRLMRLVDTIAGGTAEQIGRQLFDTVQAFAAGHPQEDDQTLVVIKSVSRR